MLYFFLIIFAIANISAEVHGRTVTVQFISLPKIADAEPIELLVAEDKYITIDAPCQDISKPYRVDKCKQWKVGKYKDADDGTLKFIEYGSVKALDTRHQLVILIRKGETNAEGFEVIVTGCGIAKFGGGSFLLVNGSDNDVAAKLGDEECTISPGKQSIVKPEIKNGTHTCHAMFSYRKNDKMKPFFSSKWQVNSHARGLICFYTDSKTGSLKMHTIRDFLD